MLQWLADFVHRRRFESGMREEMRFHMDACRDDLVRSGVPEAEARRRARIEFGGLNTIEEQCREARGLRLADELRQDLRFSWRMLRSNRAFTLAAVASLALGIGANTAVFTLVESVLLRPLPLPAPDQLIFFAHGSSTAASYPLYAALDAGEWRSFSGITAINPAELKLSTGDGVENVAAQFVSGNYFQVTGVTAAHGRVFSGLSDNSYARDPVVVISHAFWQSHLHGDRNIIGQTLEINRARLTIIGVTPPSERGFQPWHTIHLTIPCSMHPVLTGQPAGAFTHDQRLSNMMIVGRLRPGVTLEEARAETAVRYEDRQKKVAGSLLPAGRGADALRAEYRQALRLLSAMVAVLLLVACANVANLLLARATARAAEIAVRVSIGAGRGRLLRQFLTESTLLAALGGIGGIVLAWWATRGLAAFFAGGAHPVELDLSPNPRVLAFTTAATALSGLLFGVWPAIHASRLRRFTPRGGTRYALVAGQIALCVVLLSAAVFLGRTLRNLAGHEGRSNVVVAQIDAGRERPPRFADDVLAAALRLPGVDSAVLSWATPGGYGTGMETLSIPGHEATYEAARNDITPGYFQLFGVHLLSGRDFTTADRETTIVNERLARTMFGGVENAVGRRILRGASSIEIIGVVADTRQAQLREAPPMMHYSPLPSGAASRASLSLRVSGNPTTATAALRGEIRSIHPGAVVSSVRTLEQQVDDLLFRERLLSALSIVFALLALLLAAVGLYGVMSYAVARRRREIGIRMAIGAPPGKVIRTVLGESARISAVGLAAGIPLAIGASYWLGSFLYGLAPGDPATLAIVSATLAVVALAATVGPARAAAAIDPANILRQN